MTDLENMLLEAAGRTSGLAPENQSCQTLSKWQQDGSYSKRLDSPERDDDQHSSDDLDSLSIGRDLYKNDEDRKALEKLPELQREMILTERSMTRVTEGFSKTEQKPQRESLPPLPSRSCLLVRSERNDVTKSDALNELSAKQTKQQYPKGYCRLKDMLGPGACLRKRVENSPPKHLKHRASSMRGSSVGDSDESESGGRSGREEDGLPSKTKMVDNLDDDGSPSSLALQFEDVKKITIRRRKLAKWFMEPFFEEIIGGCFVRVGIGKTRSGRARYRLCIVLNVDASDLERQYKFEGYTTHKYLNCVWGSESSAARWPLPVISDSEPTKEEFNDWVQAVETTGGRMPSRQEVKDKKEAIQKINLFVYSAATVKQMLKEKKSASSRTINVAAEKDRLRKEMEVAESRQDEAGVERIRARLKELDEMSRRAKQMDAKAARLAEMNKKNRAENFKNASEVKPVNMSLKAGEAGYDPCSRRWTRSRNDYVSRPGGDRNGMVEENADTVGAEVANGVANVVPAADGLEAAVVAATAAALEAAAGARKLVDTSAPVDRGTESNSLHDFELPISLAVLQKFGGAQGAHLGFMERKQRIEATIGYKVPDDEGRRHAFTLTVSDYKRRRGLL